MNKQMAAVLLSILTLTSQFAFSAEQDLSKLIDVNKVIDDHAKSRSAVIAQLELADKALARSDKKNASLHFSYAANSAEMPEDKATLIKISTFLLDNKFENCDPLELRQALSNELKTKTRRIEKAHINTILESKSPVGYYDYLTYFSETHMTMEEKRELKRNAAYKAPVDPKISRFKATAAVLSGSLAAANGVYAWIGLRNSATTAPIQSGSQKPVDSSASK